MMISWHYGGRNKRLPTKWIVIEMTMATGWALSTEMESIDAVKDRAETNPPFPCLATEQRRNARVRRPVGWPTEGNDASPALLTFGQHSSSAYSSVCSSIGNRISMSVHKKHQLLVPPSTTRVGNLLALFSIGGYRYIFQLSFLHHCLPSWLGRLEKKESWSPKQWPWWTHRQVRMGGLFLICQELSTPR